MFKDVKDLDLEHDYNQQEREPFRHLPARGTFKEIESGAGSKTFKQDRRGIWLGAQKLEDAPFSVDMDGKFKLQSKGGGKHFFIDLDKGIWLGAEEFEDAPWSVDMDGNMKIKASPDTVDMSMEWEDASGNLGIYLGFEDV